MQPKQPDPKFREFLRAENKHALNVVSILSGVISQINPARDPEARSLDRLIGGRLVYNKLRITVEALYLLGKKHVDDELAAHVKKQKSAAAESTISNIDDYVIAKLTEETVKQIKYIASELRPQISSVIAEAQRNRESAEVIAKRLQGLMDINRSGAMMLARTEGNEVYNQAHYLLYKSRGVETVQYRAVMDERTSPICQMLNGTIWKIDDSAIQRPPLHFRCRSRLISYWGKMPGNRDFTRLTNGKTLTQEQVDGNFNKIIRFKEKYWTFQPIGEKELSRIPGKTAPDISKYTIQTPLEEKNQLMEKYKDRVFADPGIQEEIRRWDDKVKQGITSRSANMIGGDYTPERRALHWKIIYSIYKETTGDPTVVFFGGPTGSGKSGLLRYVRNRENYIYLNNDEIKKMLSEYNGLNANYLHEEARDITDMILEKAGREKRNIIYDGTLRDRDKSIARFKSFKDAGYKVKMLSANVPLKVSLDRAVGRALKVGEEGRYVPIKHIIDTAEEINRIQFDLINYVDEGIIFDSNVARGSDYILITRK